MDIKIKNLDKEMFNAFAGSTEILVDLSKDRESRNGFNPLEIFLVSLGSCVGVYTKKYLKDFQEVLKGTIIRVSGDLTKESPFRFGQVTVQISLPFRLADKKRALLNFIRNCPIHNTISNCVKINFEVLENIVCDEKSSN